VSDRIRTIDVLRALTMFFMIFVNDLWSLTGVPEWLEHTAAGEDGMGFSDVIFPMFLFIVGLSIPLAINIRFKKRESGLMVVGHILARTVALLVMGIYMVNYEVIYAEAMPIDNKYWQILMAAGIFLIWMDYKRIPDMRKGLGLSLKIAGILLLAYLAWIYRGGTAENIVWMKPHWWGILGLIGWAYLLNSLLYLFVRERLIYLLAAFLFLLFMNVQENGFFEFLPGFKLVISASNHVLVLAGMLCTVFYLKFKDVGRSLNQFLWPVSLVGLLFMAYGFLIRPVFPISKIFATPSWTAICIGISLLSYAILFVIIDKLGYYKWAEPVKPAGTSTLTCYLMPYFIYPIMVLFGFQWPYFLSDGIVGIIRSLLFSLLIIVFVGMLEKRKIRLRI
jgi:predicted acyltransferase